MFALTLVFLNVNSSLMPCCVLPRLNQKLPCNYLASFYNANKTFYPWAAAEGTVRETDVICPGEAVKELQPDTDPQSEITLSRFKYQHLRGLSRLAL